MKKTRRQFLRNVSLAAIAAGIKTNNVKASTKEALSECNKTTLDYYGEGPFYTKNPPEISDNKLASSEEKGEKIIITGRVKNLDCTEFIPNTVVDVWHANDKGEYDNSGFTLRGKTKSNSQGFYIFETIKPGKYLNGSQYRPSHIHFKITPPGENALTTQLYFKGDTDIEKDAAASIKSGQYDASERIIELKKNKEGVLEGTWDIIIDGKGITGINDLHIEKGMIYEATPNPFKEKVSIKYGVFHPSKIGLMVFNAEGKVVATLEDKNLEANKYEAIWTPDSDLAKGYYFVALKVNELQVHYQKVYKK